MNSKNKRTPRLKAKQSPPRPVSSAKGRAAFPPLGSTLSTYAPPATSARRAAAQAQKPRPAWRKWLKRIFITLMIVFIIAGGYIGAKFLINASKAFGGNIFGLLYNEKLDGEETGRVNILVAGNSADDVGHNGGDLTDSIMLISVDVEHDTAFMLSIPRDLWVNIPDNGYAKINAAYVYGKEDKFSEPGYPEGGMGMLEKVVEDNFDIDINYYALVNYTALRDAVDAVDGIEVNIKSSDPRGLYDPSRDWTGPRGTVLVKLPNGTNHLDGQQALNLARARGDAYGSYGFGQADFTRTAHQRLMLLALKDKATSLGVAGNPVRIGQLFDSFGDNVSTDIQTTKIRRISQLAQKIPSSSVKSVSLNDIDGESLLTGYRSSNGQSALRPVAGIDDFSEIQALIDKLMEPPAEPATND